MLLIRIYEECRVISFLGNHFSAVARGRMLYVIVLFFVGSAYVVLCCLVLVSGIKSLLPVFYRIIVCFS